MKEEWLFTGAVVPVDVETTAALVAEIKRLIDVVGGLVLKQGPDYERGFIDGMQKQMQSSVDKAVNQMAQEQAPVAWVSEDVCEGQYINGRPRKIWWECEKGVGTAFYTHPPQRTKQELIAYLYNMGYKAGHHDTLEGTYIDIFRQDMSTYHSDVVSEWLEDEGYTTPPQRTWVGLTDDEIDLICVGLWSGGWRKKAMQDFAKVIEAKLKQKNNYTEENT